MTAIVAPSNVPAFTSKADAPKNDPKKLILCDINGTLFNSPLNVPLALALLQAKDKGFQVVLFSQIPDENQPAVDRGSKMFARQLAIAADSGEFSVGKGESKVTHKVDVALADKLLANAGLPNIDVAGVDNIMMEESFTGVNFGKISPKSDFAGVEAFAIIDDEPNSHGAKSANILGPNDAAKLLELVTKAQPMGLQAAPVTQGMQPPHA